MSRCIPVVVVAYNRAKSLKRLLNSLNEAVYKADDVPLIISIDKGDNHDVLKVAEGFQWLHGEKKVIYQKENLKLRKHIIKCGDFALEYGNVIILEDDIFVSKYYYQYAEHALQFIDSDERIGGISLYNHRFNVEASEPFEAIDDGFDNWYFQFASSWGEAWTKKQWLGFKAWYETKPSIELREDVPQYIRNWSESSWLKYFIAYLIEKNMYFFYPKISLTTNFGEAGTHVNQNNTNHQVPLQNAEREYRFSTIDSSESIYDAFYESVYVCKQFEKDNKKTVIDLYGKKSIDYIKSRGQYVVTRKVLSYKVIKKYGCCMRPHEANIINDIPGNDFFMYDIKKQEKITVKMDKARKAQYNLRYIDKTQYMAVIQMFCQKTVYGLKRKMKWK